MARVYDNWYRLVRATLKREQLRTAGQGHGRIPSGIAGSVPPSLGKTTNIDAILQAADDIQSEDPNVARICAFFPLLSSVNSIFMSVQFDDCYSFMCEQAYSMAQNLDPNSDGRGVLQFKTGLMSVIKQKRAKRDGARIDRNRDIEHLWEFYKRYKRRHRVEDMQREEQRLRESGTFSANFGEFELRSLELKRIIANLRALVEVMEALSNDADPDGVGRLITEELRRIKRTDAMLSGELTPYNIVPLEGTSLSNAIGVFPEVRGAVSAIRYAEHFPRLPSDFEITGQRDADMFDLLEYVFGFQKDNIRNQRENVVLTVANAQSRLGILVEADPKIDEKAINEVFLKVLANYTKWCKYLRIRLAWNSLEAINRDRKLFLVSLYFLIWGEAANVRFLPECICYIFHHAQKMIHGLLWRKELDAILDHGEADPAASCKTDTGSVSYLEQIICPIYETIAAEAARNNNGKAAHSAWRNYDDFNEYFWSPACFELSWPMRKDSSFLLKPKKRKRTGKSTFVEHRTFFTCMKFSSLVDLFGFNVSAFNDGAINLDTFKSVLSIGPTFAIMNFIESFLDVVLMFGAYSTARGMAISRLIYLMDIHIWYTLLSAIIGGVMGARARLGEIRSIEMVHKRFESFPEAFAKNLVSSQTKRLPFNRQSPQDSQDMNKTYAAMFSPFWNEIIKSLREEDYISNREMDLLCIPSNTTSLRLVQWPLFLLSSKILLAIDLALDCKDTQADLWSRICRDEYMAYAVQECYHGIENFYIPWLMVKEGSGMNLVERIYREINNSILEGSLVVTLDLKKLVLVLSRFTALTGLLIWNETDERAKGAKALYEIYEVVTHDLLSSDLRTLFCLSQKELVKRLHLLLTVKDSAANVPKNLEARRRLEFFSNSLFMDMPSAKPVSEMMPFCETVLYSSTELQKENEDGISTLFYLQKIFPDEWENFLERIGRGDSTDDVELQENSSDSLELRFWASYRGQTLARTVRGMMYYRRALMLQSYMEKRSLGVGDYSQIGIPTSQGFELSRESRAQADLKFTYVLIPLTLSYSVTASAQEHRGKEIEKKITVICEPVTEQSCLLLAGFCFQDWDWESGATDGNVSKEFYSKLVKADIHGKDQEIFSIKLPGDPKLGEGKPENQNHAIIFTRGEAVQTIDMNQCLIFSVVYVQSRDQLCDLGPTRVSKPSQNFLKGEYISCRVRMHYGHPDVFDRIFHITRGGVSKASRVINISEDIYAGFNSTLRQGNITHHEYIQVGKGRDVGLNQIALFEGKVAGGNGEQVLSRDIYRIGQLFDFFRMCSFFFTTVGYYVCTMMTVLTVYIFLYGRVYLAFSGLDENISKTAKLEGNTALDAVLNAQFLVQIGVFTAVPMVMGFILELGLLKAVFSFITMQLQLCSVFFTFSLGTRTHYFGRTILHGGAKYRATGRGFVVRHIKFAENYRLYSRSHFVKALEVALLLIVYIAYGYTDDGPGSFVLLTLSSWFLVISWLFAPYIFNPSGFEWQMEDFDDWTSWLLYKGGVGVRGDDSWESWWDEEQANIGNYFKFEVLLFQYGIVYKLHLTGDRTSLGVYGLSWAVLVAIVMVFKVFTYSPKKSANFQLVMRFTQGVTSLALIAGIVLVIIFTDLSIPDLFASILAFIPTGWTILCLAVTWKKIVNYLGLWDSVREFARMYDAGMGILIFSPVALLSWFPFVSTFQSRLLYNQAFSRGLEISLILAGNKANVEA
ncbi:hypothetical protein FNV43_RR19553 [Rhamnella rubrinervis]|uniref:1,3-beta-glucan synthase n=1 Tax=Rhamnella rubrinervis TaxID=2594499 RepID=A0A8K0DZU3_9ROSA|nr:hypothetical protein FNV43_RR19553 [Rhamnella rubrinervis]